MNEDRTGRQSKAEFDGYIKLGETDRIRAEVATA
jgi:hypothetical protein